MYTQKRYGLSCIKFQNTYKSSAAYSPDTSCRFSFKSDNKLQMIEVEGHDFGPTWPPAATLTSQRNKFKNKVPLPSYSSVV